MLQQPVARFKAQILKLLPLLHPAPGPLYKTVFHRLVLQPGLCRCDAVSLLPPHSLSTLWKVPSPPTASVPGKCVLADGKKGQLCAAGFPRPAPRQRPRGMLQTIVLPAGSRGSESCRSIRDPSGHAGAGWNYPTSSPPPTPTRSSQQEKQSTLVKNNVKD